VGGDAGRGSEMIVPDIRLREPCLYGTILST
jgi:hypothetical protein